MDVDALREAVAAGRVQWRRHALARMFERGISRAAVLHVLRSGMVIEEYPHDRPYPSALLLGWPEHRPLHVVAALHQAVPEAHVVTAYRPDAERFGPDFRTRRQAT